MNFFYAMGDFINLMFLKGGKMIENFINRDEIKIDCEFTERKTYPTLFRGMEDN